MGLASKIKSSEASGATATPQHSTGQPQYSQAPSAPPYYAAPPASTQQYAQQPYYGSTYPQEQSQRQSLKEQSAYGQPYSYPSAPPAYAQPYAGQQFYGEKSAPPSSYPVAPYAPQQSHGSQAHGGEKLGSAPPSGYPVSPYAPQQSHGSQPHGGEKLGSAPPSGYPVSPYAPQQSHAGKPHEGAPNYMQSLPYQAPAAYQQYASPASNNARDQLAQKLQSIIQTNGLQRFYDPTRFQAVLQKVASINFSEIAAEWRIGKELAYDLAPLALYDIVFYCDDSGSMAFEENGDRINDLKFILSKVSGIATLFDDDGIVVRFMNSNVNGDGVRNAADVARLISQVPFSGATPLGTNFDRKVVQPFVLSQATSTMAKPVLAIIITDGEPYGEAKDTIVQVIRRAKDALARSPYSSGALAVQIAQVGKDAKTQKFLEALDKDPVVGGMIDCTSYYEMEEEEFARKGVTLTPELWLLKMCVGAIDPEYDSKDD